MCQNMDHHAQVWCKPGCRFCVAAEELLREKGYGVQHRVFGNVDELREALRERHLDEDAATFPQIFVDGAHVGGFEKLRDRVDEPILSPNALRFTPFPVRHFDVWEMYKKSLASFWLPQEIDLSKDRASWKKLTSDERFFISRVLAFFASSDGLVMENIDVNFANEVQLPEARQVYAMQQAIEAIHSHVYGLLLDTYVEDEAEKDNLFRAIQTVPSVRAKAEWAMKFMNTREPFAIRLLAFACVEGLLFSGSFCAIYYLKKRGVMPGLCLSNDFISRDEGLHTEFAIMLFNKLQHRPSTERVHAIVGEAVKHERTFITESLPCDMIGMNSRLMAQYIAFVADRLLAQLGYPAIYNATNPFDWMEAICLDSKVNFFESRSSNYARPNVMGSAKSHDDVWSTADDDF